VYKFYHFNLISGFVQDFSSCPAYYSCIRFLAFASVCPEPFHFRETGFGEGFCDWEESANCQPCPPTGLHFVSF
jgi:Chitin binding Peritrophin-A domain